ncbi:hypothetical protein ACTD5D_21895 [Nocardia takedensis]|uniref:hypothetical protein n=1 Tax=Nocardia takedensis TaxID=259390 RepID=UPI003F770DAA
MSSLEQRYTDLVDAATALGHDPDAGRIGELSEQLDRLDRELRAARPDRHRRETLLRHSRAAAELLTAARTRARGAAEVATTEPDARAVLIPTAAESRSSLGNRGLDDRADDLGCQVASEEKDRRTGR